MFLKEKLFFVLSFLIMFSISIHAQDLSGIDFENLKSDNLSDTQIQQIFERAQAQGLSVEELSALAISRGMPSSEVSKLRSRFLSIGSTSNNPASSINSNQERLRDSADETRASRAQTIVQSDTEKSIFGSSLFSNRNLTFEPSENIPTPKNHILGPGDELIIDIYGAAENNYELTVSPEGLIQISNVGPIQVSGLSIDKATSLLKNRLSNIYSGLKGDNPNTFMQVTLGKIRTIKIHILGEVKLPGTFNLSSFSTVFNALYAAGGPSSNGTYRDIKVLRENEIIATVDVYDFLVKGDQSDNIVLKDQDIIKVDPYLNRVSVTGQTKRTGLFETKQGETFQDLLSYVGGFNHVAYTKTIKIRRNTEFQRAIVELDYPEEKNTVLKSGDQLIIGRVLDRYENRVEIQGAVFREGEYQLEENPTLTELIKSAEGLMGDAFLDRAIIYRTNPDYTVSSIPVNLNEVLNSDNEEDIKLEKDDIVKISSIFDLRENRTVTISGQVIDAGTFPYLEDMTLEDLVFQANGFKDGAATYNVNISRRILDDGSGMVRNELAEVFEIDIKNGLILNDSNPEFVLEPFDQVYIRKSPTYEVQQSVSINGQVIYPGTYSIKNRSFTISDLVEAGGGITEYAYLKGATLNRPRASDSTDVVAIDLEEILASPDSEQDLLLLPGDRLSIPKKLETVLVDGEVLSPSNIRFDKGKSFRSYLNSAGGTTDSAAKNKAYIQYANGEVKRMRRFLFIKNYPKVEPGSRIIVPTKPEKPKLSPGERIAIYSTIVSMAAIVTNTIFQIRRDNQ